MSLNIVRDIDDFVKIEHVLVSVSDKKNLETLIPNLIEINPDIKFFSTGGTYSKLKEILGEKGSHSLTSVSEYTGQPETQGGLVKTLDFKIYLGILTEKYNEHHMEDLKRTLSVPIDMVIVNLYPFKETIKKEDATVEHARTNIDIGGPCMIRAAAKNYLRVASIVDPRDYEMIISHMKKNSGMLSLEMRFNLAKKAFTHTADYDTAISNYLNSKTFESVKSCSVN
ncbi:MAG: hypothetical protein HQK79_09430 [Desulfobacterales bacterium]|nr:hypothetical protein [Desulfobacterales bacterium]MBF0397017.1 hypothetical protein [Desulfobacterales bacterium]